MSNPIECITTNVFTWMANDCTNKSLLAGEEFYTQLFNNFYNNQHGLYIPGIYTEEHFPDSDNLQFQGLLADICNLGTNGRYCREPLIFQCSVYNREDAQNPTVKQMCGCYLSQNNYSSNVNRSCDTLCSSYNGINYYPSINSTTAEQCITNVCIIDNITINAVNSNVGDITFTQVCPYCSGVANCQCIINDVNIITQNSSLGAIGIVQDCGDNSICYQRQLDGTQAEVPCSEYFSEFGTNPTANEQYTTIYTRLLWGFFIFALVFLIIFMVVIAYIISTPSPEIRQTINLSYDYEY